LFGLASLLMVHLFGPQLEPAAVVLRILAWTLVPLALAVTLAQMLFSANRQAIDLRVNLIATVVTVVANVLVIPRWGEVGVAFVSLGVTTLYATLQYVWVKQHVADPMSLGLLGKLLLVALMGAGMMLVLRGAGEPIAFLAGSGVYGLGLLATGLVTVEELRRGSASVGRLVFRGRRARTLQRRSSLTL
jgi:O-antigen/teichoic acid export membrane protein